MHSDTKKYNETQTPDDREICQLLAEHIDRGLPEAENKIWHAHPVWFLDGNPVVGYSKLTPRMTTRGTFAVLGVASRIGRGSESPELFGRIWKTFESRRQEIEPVATQKVYATS